MDRNYFNSRFTTDKNREVVWKALCKYLQKEIDFSSKVLDLGAGYCDFINNIKCREKHAVDLFHKIAEYSKGDVQTHIGTCSNLVMFGDSYFDVVLTSNLFEHLEREELEKTIVEVRRVLKDRGKLIIIQPNFKYSFKEYFDDYTHRLIFTDVSLCDFLISNDFIIKKVIPKFIPFSMKTKLPKIAFLIKLYLLIPFRPFGKQMLVIALANKTA